MAKTIHSTKNAGNGQVNYQWPMSEGSLNNIGGPMTPSVLYRSAGTASNLYFYIGSNTGSAATIKTNINGVDGNLTVSIGSGATGAFEDVSNSDSIASGDAYGLVWSGMTASKFLANDIISFVFDSSSDSIKKYCNDFFINASTNCSINAGASTTESNVYAEFKGSATVKNLGVSVVSNSRINTSTVISRKNGADGNLTVSIGSGATGTFEDTANSDSVSAGDSYNNKISLGAGTQFIYGMIYLECLTTASESYFFNLSGFAQNILSTSTVSYNSLSGSSVTNATDARTKTKIYNTGTFSLLYLNITSNNAANTVSVYLRVNTTDSALTLSIPASTTGEYLDNTNSASVTSGDLVNIKTTTAANSTVSHTRGSVTYAPTSGAPTPNSNFLMFMR